MTKTLQWRHNEHDGVSNQQPHDSKKTSKLRVTGLRAGNLPVAGEFPHKGPVTRKMFPFDEVIMNISRMVPTVLCCIL